MKAYVRGRTISFREVCIDDSEFIVALRTDPEKGRFISKTQADVRQQREFIRNYQQSETDFYFIISDVNKQPIGTIRIYDIQGDSFCWGSWILTKEASTSAAIESALLIYDFAFFSLHYKQSHFDVRKENQRVVKFHENFGAKIIKEDELNFYFEYNRDVYFSIRSRYARYIA